MNSNLLQDTESRKHYVSASSRHKAGAGPGAGSGSDLYDEDDCADNMAYSSSPNTGSERSSKAQGSSLGPTPSLATKSINRENVFNGRSMQYPLSESKAQPFPEYLRCKIHRKEEQQEMHEQEQRHYNMRRQESLIKEEEVEAEKVRVVMCNQYDAHHLHSYGHQQQKATMRYPSRDLGLQNRSPLKGTTDFKGIKTDCLNKPVCAHTEQICRDGVALINGSLKELIQYNGARNEKHVNRYELFSQLHDSTYVGVNFKNKSERNKYGNCGEVVHDGDVVPGEGNRSFLNLHPEEISSSYCSDKRSSPRTCMAVAINSISTCEGVVSDKHQSRKHSTLAPGSRLGSDSLIPDNFMSASLSSYQIANKLRGRGRGRGRESTYSPSERSLRSKSAGSISKPLHKPTSHKRSARSISLSPRRQDGYSVTQGHYMGLVCKRYDVHRVSSEPTVHRHPQALSPSLIQPPFRPTGWGGSPSPSSVLNSEPHGDSREEYRFCTRDLSPSGDGTPFLKAVRRKNSNEQELIMRSAARERLFKPSRPIGERLCGARPVFKYKESPSTLSDPSSRFLRDINEGVTPNLREYKEISNSPIRCVFRPLGGSCDIPVPLQEYDQRIKGALRSSSYPHPHPLVGAIDRGSNIPQVSFVNIEMRHPSPPTCITPSSFPPFLQAFTESISAVTTDFEVNMGHNDDVADDTEDSFGTPYPPWQHLDRKLTSRSIEYSPCTTSNCEEENTVEKSKCLNPLGLSQNTLYPANEGEDSIDEV